MHSAHCSKCRLLGEKQRFFVFQIQEMHLHPNNRHGNHMMGTLVCVYLMTIRLYKVRKRFCQVNLLFVSKWRQKTPNLHTLKT